MRMSRKGRRTTLTSESLQEFLSLQENDCSKANIIENIFNDEKENTEINCPEVVEEVKNICDTTESIIDNQIRKFCKVSSVTF